MSLFITGSGTGVGKTRVTALLIREWRKRGVDCVGMKPICCGARDDPEDLFEASGGIEPLNRINPVWLRTPAAPYAASMVENRAIDLDLVFENFRALQSAHASVIVEGAGGWRVPIRRDYFVSHLARDMQLPIAVVVANRLGALNDAILTVQSIKSDGLMCAGLILNQPHPAREEDSVAIATNASVLEEILGIPILLELAFGQTSAELPAALLAK